MLSFKQYLLENQEDFIVVNGIKRSRMNSLGTPIHPTEEGIINFWKWFGDSKVVDNKGRPLVVYHGTNKDFDAFKTGLNKAKDEQGIFFSPNPEIASAYSGYDEIFPIDVIGSVIKCYLKIIHLYDFDFMGSKEGRGKIIQFAVNAGFDGVVLQNHYDVGGISDQYVVFSPNQIKSAMGNNGNFNPNSSKLTEAQYQGKTVTLDKPKSSDNPKKKYMVYVKNEKGNVVKVYFGDPNMEIRRDNTNRRKAFRSRHSCDDDKPNKWEPRYWACKFWDKEKVSDLL